MYAYLRSMEVCVTEAAAATEEEAEGDGDVVRQNRTS